MSDKTTIEWTATITSDGSVTPGATWNPIRARRKDNGKVGWHCERVSQGCEHCYAAALNRRNLNVGTGLDYVRSSRDQVDIIIDEKTLLAPLKWKRPRKVFVCSMTDLFAEFVPFEFVDRVFAVMALCPQHTFQCLTKRPERMAEYFDDRGYGSGYVMDAAIHIAGAGAENSVPDNWHDEPLPNVWLGCTVENQAWVDKRIPHLLKCPASVRFLSCEPLLGPIDLSAYMGGEYVGLPGDVVHPNYNFGIDWVIAGCESGPKRRETKMEWVELLRDQCESTGVAFFNKQMSINGKVTGDFELFPESLRIREFPQPVAAE